MGATAKPCQASLLSRIDELRILKAEQEAQISQQFQDLKNSITVGNILKESISHIAEDKDTQKDIVKIAATTGTNFLIEKLLGSNNSIKGYLGSLLAEKVSGSFIGKWISKF
ncbi:hypothetical protein [Flavobacterium wongokense]|uniref:hypothetical protein n=1 Tax=Flavobacterium wongokense TaxID=2910674 RepID=UPI001F485180|nr:hypothetical protein [Flavobacterium sp. WG47]MCF6131961.1 hypothetical protein [Flavobacterium sp. WG47]